MSTYYPNDQICSCEIAGAVATAAIHDLRVNLFSLSGFPQIHVDDLKDDSFKITLSWSVKEHKAEVIFDLSHADAISAAKNFKKDKGVDKTIFDRVQSALASLEGAANNRQDRP